MKNIFQMDLPEFLKYSIKYSFTILIMFIFTTNVFSQECDETTIARLIKSGISEKTIEEQCSKADNFSGTYSYYMTLPGGGIEKGIVKVRKNKEIYEIIWKRSDGPQYYGLGINTGNLLSVAYSYGAPSGQGERCVFISMYQLKKKL